SGAPEADWTQLRPLLDDAMHTLDDEDREAVLLRHFENRSYAEIGAVLGLKENSARMRVERALDKLQAALVRRGMASTAAVLGGLLAAHAVGVAPADLTAKVLKTTAGVAATSGLAVISIMYKAAALTAVIAGVVAGIWFVSSRTPASKSTAAAVAPAI